MRFALLAAGALLATSPVTGHSPAQATGSSHRAGTHAVGLPDGPGDVWTYSDFSSGYEQTERPTADVLRARVAHGTSVVRVRMVFDDLKRVDTQRYWYDIRIPDGRTLRFVLEAKQGHWGGEAWQEIEGEWVHVRGLRAQIDYASDEVELNVARSLLDRPGWVRVRLRNELGLSDGSTFFTDNPTTATHEPTFTRRLQPR